MDKIRKAKKPKIREPPRLQSAETEMWTPYANGSDSENSFMYCKLSTSGKYRVIKELSDKHSVSLLCETFNVPKGSYYNYLLRNKNENTLASQKRAELTPVIDSIFHENNEIYGSGKIHAILKDRGYKVSKQTVADIMHENDMFPVRSSAKILYLKEQERKKNILNR